ncbi:TauD/TfdA family dioxygenase [Tsuneonella sp. CC-YZS046]|jgi:alpha-ketoglutarate-dependent 2,4-dichlorophenoxyacetate dioxygenase|uniref:TauD/TfdA dioxygenase family protein n=1 Tax=Tsuneonella sp. CC-YZS046 TaxID=3042152 RepID=UPI002D77E345|nr:TauD/TfdA family dioxygenase [Tsuneonella sp. CC-YZS046]WRO66665.1 TauD/TfdA family dioxygenase [Tsuneonella sp. CC-YZS046]
MLLDIRKIHEKFGSEILDFQISDGILQEEAKEIRDVVEQYGVILLRGQNLTEDTMINFSDRLGGRHKFVAVEGQPSEFIYRVSNLDVNGNILSLDDVRMRSNAANELWHTDTTYQRPRTALSMLYAIEVAPEGGETEFCDTRCAYEALSEQEKSTLEGLIGKHSVIQSRALTGFHDWTDEQRRQLQIVARPLVEMHRPSGRKALCIASHVGDIAPLPKEEGLALLKRLIDAATGPGCVYTHHWKPRDLLIWDNRCTMHRARPYEYTKHARDYRTARVEDHEDIE